MWYNKYDIVDWSVRSLGLGFYLSVAMLPVMIILTIIFVLKKKVNNEETKIYSYILITSIVMTLLEIVSAILFRDYLETFAYNLIAKLVLASYIMVNFLFCSYLMTVCKRPKWRINILRVSSLVILKPWKHSEFFSKNLLKSSNLNLLSTKLA